MTLPSPCPECRAEPTRSVAHITHPAFCGGRLDPGGIRHDGFRHRPSCPVYAAKRAQTAPKAGRAR